MAKESYDFLFKLVLVGDSGVEKSSLMSQFAGYHHGHTTIGVEFRTKIIELHGKKINLQIWDTAGQERYRAITAAYYRGAKGIMLVYSIIKDKSFENIKNWIREVKEHAPSNVVMMLIGNMCDLKHLRIVSRERASKFAEECGIRFMEVSSEENINVEEAFYTLARDILEAQERRLMAEELILRERSITQETQKTRQSKGFFSSVKDFFGRRVSRNDQPKSLTQSSSNVEQEPDQSKVPPEILARGDLALRAYNDALMEGKTCVERVPVMCIGQERSGKTSLIKSLRGQAFNPDEESTVGIDVDPSHFKVTTEIWETGKKDQESGVPEFSYEHHAAQFIAGSLMVVEVEPSTVVCMYVPSSDSFAPSENQEPTERAIEPVKSQTSLPAIGDSSESSHGLAYKHSEAPNALRVDVPNPSELHQEDASNVPEEIATLVERLLHKEEKVEDDQNVYSVLWDFGGQSVYYVTHPLFLTSRAIYLLVYDLSRSPHDKGDPLVKQGMFKKIEDNFSLKTNLDYLDFWMTSVASLAGQREKQPAASTSDATPERLPPVFLVCTHADQPHSGEDPFAVASEIFDFLQNKPYSAHLFAHVFVVDNTMSGGRSECPEVLRLRQEVLAVAKELPQMKEAIPIKWLKYEKALEVLKDEGNQWISLEQAKEIAYEVCKISDDQEILTLLNFLHDQRILIHFDDTPELNKLVVLDPQWLIDVFKKVITVKRYDHEEREFKDLWRKLEQTGILDEKLLEHAWGDLLDQAETSESLIAIMEKFSLMCPWPSSEASCGKQFLVPSMLMSHPPQGIMNLLESAQIPSLFLKFESRQIPPSLFPRLVLQFFQWYTEEFPSPVEPQLHHNFARFYMSPDVDCSVVLLCHSSSLEVVMLSETRSIDLNDLGEGSQSKVCSSTDQSQCKFEVSLALAVRRQLVLLLECMKREFCWLNNIRCEVCFLCPACSKGGRVNFCQAHRVEGCKQQECLHFWSELELYNFPQAVICRKSVDAVDTKVEVKQFAPWLILLTEKKSTHQVDGRCGPLMPVHEEEPPEKLALPLPSAAEDGLLSQTHDAQAKEDVQLGHASQENPGPGIEWVESREEQALALDVCGVVVSQSCDVQDVVLCEDLPLSQASLNNQESDDEWVEPAEEQALALPSAVQDALLSQSCDAQDVVARLQEDLQLEQASLENPDPETTKMIRSLTRKAKCSNRIDVVKHLREVTPAGTTGPLLRENLDVQNVPLQQIRELSVHLCGGDEWMMVAERLGLTPAEIRFLERRCRNPFEPALVHSRNQQYLNAGQLYDALVECGYPVYADFL